MTKSKAADVLVNEYGITNMSELDEAIGKLGVIDLLPFCAEIKSKRRYKNGNDNENERLSSVS